MMHGPIYINKTNLLQAFTARNKHTQSPITAYNDTITVVSRYFEEGFTVLLEPAINVPTEIQILEFKNKTDWISGTTLKLKGDNNEK